MNIVCGVTTSPRDGADYLPATMKSLHTSGFDRITIRHGEGIVSNWGKLLAWLTMTTSDAILMCQDDIILCSDLRKWIDASMWPSASTGAVSLYCPAKYPGASGFFLAPEPGNTWGACALLIPVNVAHKILIHPTFQAWPRERALDRCVGQTVAALGLDFWYVRPSLIQHVGHVSALPGHSGGAAGNRAAADFIGEDVSAFEIPAINAPGVPIRRILHD